jgi:hypothetical protein
MNITRSYTGMGDEHSAGYLTVLIFPGERTQFTLHHPDQSGSTHIEVIETEKTIAVSMDGIQKAHILRIDCSAAPKQVVLDGMTLSDTEDYHYDHEDLKLVIKTDRYVTGKYIIAK